MYVCGMPSGLQSVPSVVLPRTSFGPLTMTYLSAPGFSAGAFAPAGRPAKLYTPVRSGFPSGIRKLLEAVFAAGAEAGFAAGAPATVTVTVLEGPFRSVNV